jgi:hypothetical protein
MEVRIENIKPIAVSHQDETVDLAVKGAILKAKASLDTVLGKIKDH